MRAAFIAMFAVLLIGPLAAAALSDDAYAAAADDYDYVWKSEKHYLTINQGTLVISVDDKEVVNLLPWASRIGELSVRATNFPSWATVAFGGSSGYENRVDIRVSPGMAYDGELWIIYRVLDSANVKLVVPLKITGTSPAWGGDEPVSPDDPSGNNKGSGEEKPKPGPSPLIIPTIWDDVVEALTNPGSLALIIGSSLFFALFVRSRVRTWY
jgi:hypothetical protein